MTVSEFVSAHKRAGRGFVSWVCGGEAVYGGEGLLQTTNVYFLHPFTHPHPPSKGNDLAQTLFVQKHSAGQKWGVMIKGLCDKKSKMEPLVDMLFPRTITLPAVPNRRVQEISAREGSAAQGWWLARKLRKSNVYIRPRI